MNSEAKLKNTDIAPFDEIVDYYRGSLHDYLNMLWFGGRVKAEYIAELLKIEGSPHTKEANELLANLDEVHSALRLLLLNMRMPRLGNQPFRDALLEYTGFLSKDISLSFAGDETISQSPQIADTFFIICREAIANATRHGEARHITITIEKLDTEIHLKVTDNGRGFDPNTIKSKSGIYYMEKFAESLGGVLSLSSELGSGTTLSVSVPVDKNKDSDNDRQN